MEGWLEERVGEDSVPPAHRQGAPAERAARCSEASRHRDAGARGIGMVGRMRVLAPEVPVVFVSGFTAEDRGL
jgi:hypothetical protein